MNRKTIIKRPSDDKEFQFCYEDIKEPKLIGEGAFGVVFKIHHEISDMNLAVKRVDGKKLDESNNLNREIMDIFVPIKVFKFIN